MPDSCNKFFYSRFKPLLKVKEGNEEIQLRVGQDARKDFCEFIDSVVDQQLKWLIDDAIPKKPNGDLKRITIQSEDFIDVFSKSKPKANYLKSSAIKEKLVYGEQRLRVAQNAKPDFNRYINESVEIAIKRVIWKLPHGTKGSHKGELKRITFHEEDFK